MPTHGGQRAHSSEQRRPSRVTDRSDRRHAQSMDRGTTTRRSERWDQRRGDGGPPAEPARARRQADRSPGPLSESRWDPTPDQMLRSTRCVKRGWAVNSPVSRKWKAVDQLLEPTPKDTIRARRIAVREHCCGENLMADTVTGRGRHCLWRRLNRAVWAAGIAVIVALAGLAAPAYAAGSLQIAGTVTDQNGVGVSNVSVTATQ